MQSFVWGAGSSVSVATILALRSCQSDSEGGNAGLDGPLGGVMPRGVVDAESQAVSGRDSPELPPTKLIVTSLWASEVARVNGLAQSLPAAELTST